MISWMYSERNELMRITGVGEKSQSGKKTANGLG